jgi:shikimate dehydrogenase
MAGSVQNFLGVLGWPLETTLSPAIHGAALRRLGFDWTYLAFPVAPEQLGDAVKGLRALGAIGANVTIPHKETVIPFLDQVSGDAAAIGAVNTIQRVGDRLIGHNTDVDGFAEFVAGDAGIKVEGTEVLVLGAGGAARAVVKALDDLGARSVSICTRSFERGAPLTELVGRAAASVHGWDKATQLAEEADLVVNATPLGMDGEDALPDATWHEGQSVVDLVYAPPSTPLVEAARAGGADAWGGLGMLVRQAAASFQLWTGQDPPLEVMSAAAVHAIGPSHSTRPHGVPKKG